MADTVTPEAPTTEAPPAPAHAKHQRFFTIVHWSDGNPPVWDVAIYHDPRGSEDFSHIYHPTPASLKRMEKLLGYPHTKNIYSVHLAAKQNHMSIAANWRPQ